MYKISALIVMQQSTLGPVKSIYVTNIALSQARNRLLCNLTSIIIIHDSITTFFKGVTLINVQVLGGITLKSRAL